MHDFLWWIVHIWGEWIPINVGGLSINFILWSLLYDISGCGVFLLSISSPIYVCKISMSTIMILFGAWWDVLWSLWGLFVQIATSKDHDNLKREHPKWSDTLYAHSFRMNILVKFKHGVRSSMVVWSCHNCMTSIIHEH